MEASTAVTAGQRGYSFFVSGCATALEIGETKSGGRRDENSKREASTKCFDLLYFFLSLRQAGSASFKRIKWVGTEISDGSELPLPLRN